MWSLYFPTFRWIWKCWSRINWPYKYLETFLAKKKKFEDLIKAESFNRIVTEFFQDNTKNGATLVLSYIKSVSAMLLLVSSVRKSDIKQNL